MEPTLIWILVSVLGGFVLALLLGRGLVPALRALKAGQSIREVGPKWHQGKSGTPTMGGIVFILSSLLCIVTGCMPCARPATISTCSCWRWR